jgi:hypothetical protein
VYAREVEGRTLTLHVSGMLWGKSVVLADVETLSEWSHILGRAMYGPLKGKELQVIPSVMVTWKRWRQFRPATTVTTLVRSSEEYTADFYRQPQRFVLGVKHRGETVAYPLTELMRQTAISDDVGDDPIVAVYDGPGAGATAYRRAVGGQPLEFVATNGRLLAGESAWSLTTGEALDGPYRGQRLERVAAMISYEDAWRAYYPRSRWFARDSPTKDNEPQRPRESSEVAEK